MRISKAFALALAVNIGLAFVAEAQTQPVPSKTATAATKAANQQVQQSLPFSDKTDFADALTSCHAGTRNYEGY